MLAMKFVIARLSALTFVGLCLCLGFGQAAKLRDAQIASPTAIATDAAVSYCFARVRGLDPERLPPAYLVLRLRVTVSYRNSGARALILPLERERIVYSAIKPGEMSVYKGLGLFDQSFKAMKELPPEVSLDSPLTPKNDVFTVIPAGGEMTPPLMEEITMPVSAKGLFKRTPDLRGKRVYVKLRYVHRELTPALLSNLSDRWSRFGEPWTGTVTTNTIMIDVPAAPGGDPCVDAQTPAHPAVGEDDKK